MDGPTHKRSPATQEMGDPQSAGRDESPLRVLFIGGGTKSGSTLLDLMLGQVPTFFSVGELRQIWQRGCVENAYCGCKERFFDCPFWSEVGDVAFGGWHNLDIEETLAQRDGIDRVGSFRILRRAHSTGDLTPSMVRYLATLRALLRAVQEVSKAEVIVDSSKAPTHALLLDMISDVRFNLVHLVRDSRGVTFSWKRSGRGERRKRKLRSVRGRLAVNIRAPVGWLSYNRQIPRLAELDMSYVRLRYEDLVSDPRGSLQRLLATSGLIVNENDLAFVRDGTIVLGRNHTVYGNRLRFSSGELPLRVDDQWRTEMTASSRTWVTALTFPLLLKYGYRLRSGFNDRSPAAKTAR
jgi:Sulfotransferase family